MQIDMEEIVVVKVTLGAVMEQLKLMSSYLGGKREGDVAAYDRVAAIDSDADLVGLLMEDAALLLAPRLPGRLLRWRYAGQALEFVFEGRIVAEGLDGAIAKAVGMVVLRRWLRIAGSEYADAVSASADELAGALEVYFPSSEERHHPLASARRLPPM